MELQQFMNCSGSPISRPDDSVALAMGTLQSALCKLQRPANVMYLHHVYNTGALAMGTLQIAVQIATPGQGEESSEPHYGGGLAPNSSILTVGRYSSP